MTDERQDRANVIGRMVYGADWPALSRRARRKRVTAAITVGDFLLKIVLTDLIMIGLAIGIWRWAL